MKLGKLSYPICLNCGASVRALKNAPEIYVHVWNDRRTCDDGTNNLAETVNCLLYTSPSPRD